MHSSGAWKSDRAESGRGSGGSTKTFPGTSPLLHPRAPQLHPKTPVPPISPIPPLTYYRGSGDMACAVVAGTATAGPGEALAVEVRAIREVLRNLSGDMGGAKR